MSDRFYAQMGKHFDMAPWELQVALRDEKSDLRKTLEKKSMPKVTRKELSVELSDLLGVEINATKLPMNTLQAVVESFRNKKAKQVEMPTGRLKAPYVEALHVALNFKSPVDFSTATVALMKEILENIK